MSHLSRVFQLLRNRQAIRGFEERPVPLTSLARILDCGRYTPSAKEDQPWAFVVVQDPLSRHRLAAEAFHSPFVRSAPVLIVACARIHSHVSGHGRPSHPVDVAAGVQSMALAAADMGLAAVWITGYRESGIRKILSIPDDVPIVAILTIGYPDGFAALPDRRPEEEVVVWEHWTKETTW
ncbi:MAG: nitroreductase family protein [Gemmatimonadota bacterium]